MMQSVLFVCIGNICRSPAAEVVFNTKIKEFAKTHNLDCSNLIIDSAGTSNQHIGSSPDKRMIKTCIDKGYDISLKRARQIILTDYYMFDLILAMDSQVFLDVKKQAPHDVYSKIELFMDYHPEPKLRNVPDPYFGKQEAFDKALSLIEVTMPRIIESFKNCEEANANDQSFNSFDI